MKKSVLLLAMGALVIVAYSCKKESETSSSGKSVYLDLPSTPYTYFTTGSSSTSAADLNNIATLGRVLFYDGHMSINNATACASCHKQEAAFADNVAFSRGFENRLTGRNSMPIENMGSPTGSVASTSILFWDGREKKLQNLVARPVTNHVEMGMDFNALPAKLGELSYYPDLFQKAYGSKEITADKISQAVTYFMQSITANASRFDDYQNKKVELTAQELQGFNLFNTTYGCNRCHSITVNNNYYSSATFADIGLGGGTVAKQLEQHKLNFDIVEIDGRLTNISKEFFGFQSTDKVVVDDGRHYINVSKKKYDLVIIDALLGENIPSQLLSLECFTRLKSNLTPGGHIFIEFDGIGEDADGVAQKMVYNTMIKAGYDTHVFSSVPNVTYADIMYVASPQKLDKAYSYMVESNKYYPYTGPLKGFEVTLQAPTTGVLTDEKPALDYLLRDRMVAFRQEELKEQNEQFLEDDMTFYY